MSEIGDDRVHQSRQVAPMHAHQFAVRARAEGNLFLFGQTRIGVHRHVVEIAKRRHRAGLAVGKRVLEFQFRSDLDRSRASVLLSHVPHSLPIPEKHGISLQLSGHTHLGQFIPWSWMARRMYRQFVYGLSRIGQMQIFTSSGAGTWGPPLRLGSKPEIVMLQFE